MIAHRKLLWPLVYLFIICRKVYLVSSTDPAPGLTQISPTWTPGNNHVEVDLSVKNSTYYVVYQLVNGAHVFTTKERFFIGKIVSTGTDSTGFATKKDITTPKNASARRVVLTFDPAKGFQLEVIYEKDLANNDLKLNSASTTAITKSSTPVTTPGVAMVQTGTYVPAGLMPDGKSAPVAQTPTVPAPAHFSTALDTSFNVQDTHGHPPVTADYQDQPGPVDLATYVNNLGLRVSSLEFRMEPVEEKLDLLTRLVQYQHEIIELNNLLKSKGGLEPGTTHVMVSGSPVFRPATHDGSRQLDHTEFPSDLKLFIADPNDATRLVELPHDKLTVRTEDNEVLYQPADGVQLVLVTLKGRTVWFHRDGDLHPVVVAFYPADLKVVLVFADAVVMYFGNLGPNGQGQPQEDTTVTIPVDPEVSILSQPPDTQPVVEFNEQLAHCHGYANLDVTLTVLDPGSVANPPAPGSGDSSVDQPTAENNDTQNGSQTTPDAQGTPLNSTPAEEHGSTVYP